MEPERIEIVYFVRYYGPIRKKRFTTSYKLTEEQARERFGEFELVQASSKMRTVGGDWRKNSAAHFHTGSPGKK